jgi:hypothetical protein
MHFVRASEWLYSYQNKQKLYTSRIPYNVQLLLHRKNIHMQEQINE